MDLDKYLEKNTLVKRWRLQTVQTRTIDYDPQLLKPGDSILATPAYNIPYLYHYGVYVGDKKVVHVQSEGVVQCELEEFCHNRTKVKIDQLVPLPHEIDHPELMDQRRELITHTAKSMIGDKWQFNAMSENCESFTNWVTTGKMHSQQGIVFRNSAFLYGAMTLGYFLGRRRIRFWRPSWWMKKQ